MMDGGLTGAMDAIPPHSHADWTALQEVVRTCVRGAFVGKLTAATALLGLF